MIRIIHSLVIALALIAGVETAQAGPAPQGNSNPQIQVPNVQPQAPQNQDNRPVIHKGSEDLPGMGELMFTFYDNGKVQMIDASRRPVNGTFTVVGQRLTITFGDCVYEGNVVNGVYTGSARFTSGQNTGTTWNFNTQFVGRA